MDNEQSHKLDPKKNDNILQIELKSLYYAREAVSVLSDYVLDTSIGGFDEFCDSRSIPPYEFNTYRQYCTSAYPELYNLVSWKYAAYKSDYLKNEEKVSKIVLQKMLELKERFTILDYWQITNIHPSNIYRQLLWNNKDEVPAEILTLFQRMVDDLNGPYYDTNLPFNGILQKMLGDIPESDLEMAINFCNLNKMPLTVSVLITVNNALKSRKYQADQILEPEYKMQFDMDRRNYYANICKTENTLGKIEDEIRIDEEQLQLHTSDLPGARR